MTSDTRRRIEELFEAALDIPAQDRCAFLSDATGGDPRLIAEVMALLGSHHRPDGILERSDTAIHGSLPAAAPRRIGSYRVVGELGRGGMGVIYTAERDDGHFRRRVAIKVLRADADPSLEARVVAERQILASLDHPSIARLLDGGVTEDGRPFLVMEHVDGLPVDVYADRMRLTLDERIELFNTVAEAVQHAHRNLVVHRDLKPSNILVTSSGHVKLLDFGIAKLLNPTHGPDYGPVTLGDRQAFTPEYASPEQVRGEPLSTATDVYSLGVVLFRLLTGRHPYELNSTSMQSIVEVVAHRPPLRPSEVVAQLDEDAAEEIAASRRTTPGRLQRLLKGDLDAIVLQALRKQAVDRYGSPELMARDLERCRTGRPVEARKGARGYRVRTFLRRHRYALAAAALVALSLVGGTGAALWQARVASTERDRTAAALRQSEEIGSFLMELFTAGERADVHLEEITAGDLLRRGVGRVDELSSQPLLQARMLTVMANVHQQLGQFDEAVRLHRRSLATFMSELGPEAVEVARGMNHLGVALRNVAGFDEARALHAEALRIERAALPPGDTALARTLLHQAYIEFDLQRRALLQREALAIQTAALAPADSAVISTWMALANTERGLGRYNDALAFLRQALAAGQQASGAQDPYAAVPMLHMGDILYVELGQTAEAEALYRRALEIQENRLGRQDVLLIHGLHSLGDLLGSTGRHEEAESILRRASDILIRALGPTNPRIVDSYLNLADELLRQRRWSEADSLFRQVIGIVRDARGDRHPSIANARAARARGLEQMGRLDEAEAEVRAALEIRAAALGERSILVGLTLTQIGDVLRRKGQPDRARAAYHEGRQILLAHIPPDHPQVRDIDLRLETLDLEDRTGPATAGPGR